MQRSLQTLDTACVLVLVLFKNKRLPLDGDSELHLPCPCCFVRLCFHFSISPELVISINFIYNTLHIFDNNGFGFSVRRKIFSGPPALSRFPISVILEIKWMK